jgi:serine/threonine-protein kinase RsbW
MEARTRVYRGFLPRSVSCPRRLPQGEPRDRGNTVKHGHRGGSDAPVWITLSAEGEQVSLVYEDRAPPFNPFASATREMLEALAETRREGGLGVLLAHGLTASNEYSYVFGRNRIHLTLG